MAIEQVNVGGPHLVAPYVDGVALNNSCQWSDDNEGTNERGTFNSSRSCKSRPDVRSSLKFPRTEQYLQRSI